VSVAAAVRALVPVRVVGGGAEPARLRRRFTRANFLGRVKDHGLVEPYACCHALVVQAIEEFGITMVEAHAAGRDVVAAARGGALEIVGDAETGILCPLGSVEALAEALRAIDWERFDVPRLRASADRFSVRRFQSRFGSELARLVGGTFGDAAKSPFGPSAQDDAGLSSLVEHGRPETKPECERARRVAATPPQWHRQFGV
jgi:glycosyltransferase involved in cell wall biosynthesis